MAPISERVDVALARHQWRHDERYGCSEEMVTNFESAIGFRLPAAMRYIFKHSESVDLGNQMVCDHHGTRSLGYMTLWHPEGIALVHPTLGDVDMYAFEDERTAEWLEWLRSLIPFAQAKGQSLICLDYAFDPVDPPVIFLDGEREGIHRPGVRGLHVYRPVRYLAASFLAFLELEVLGSEDELFDTTISCVSQRLVDWYEHRDRILGDPPQRSPTRGQVNVCTELD